jgi:hypothetical protein
MTTSERVEALLDRLHAIAKALPGWLRTDREELTARIVAQVLDEYRAIPAPEPSGSVETGLDFLGLLLAQGSDHGLYESSMEQLDSDIYSAITALPDDEQIVLLLPFEVDELHDLFADRDIAEWPRFLRAGQEWPSRMRRVVLNHVELRHRIK